MLKQPPQQEPSTMKTTTIGIDLAKSIFQLHGIDAEGKVLLKKKLRRQALLSFLAG